MKDLFYVQFFVLIDFPISHMLRSPYNSGSREQTGPDKSM